jgi:hypothetical protein
MVTKTIEKIPAIIGGMSCVAINTEKFPVSFGNYFDFASGERCLNMWAENFGEYCVKNRVTVIECTVFSNDQSYRLAFITDSGVPTEWLHKKLCVTGRGWGSRELCEACCNFQGASIVNLICGCEKPNQSPHIIQHYDHKIEEPACTNICSSCNREWPNIPEN